MGMPPLPPDGSNHMREYELERKIHDNDEHSRHLSGSGKESIGTKIIGVIALLLVVAAPICWIIFGLGRK